MQIKSLTLKNFRGFKDTEITFSEGLTVLVGVNGAGKSSVLDALAMMMSQVSSQWKDSIERLSIAASDVHADSNLASVGIWVEHLSSQYAWEVNRSGGKDGRSTDPAHDLNTLGYAIRQKLTRTNESIAGPILIFYPAIRLVLDVPIPPPSDAGLLQPLEAYAGCLAARAENFHDFFKWFRAREDYENERIREEGDSAMPDYQLTAIRKALSGVLSNISNPVVKRFLDTIVVEKNGTVLQVDRLSDGEKLLLAIAGDIARRMAILNPGVDNPLHGEGVVLIDEIEQHLHPKWQREIIGNLRRTFPNVQFIVSTHSPQVLGEVNHEDIRCLYLDPEKGQQVYVPQRSLGLDSNSILEEVFDAGRRNAGVAEKLEKIFELIALESFDTAQEHIAALETELDSDIPDLIKAKTMIAMLEGSGAEHS